MNSGSSAPAVWTFPDLGQDESLGNGNIHDLPKGTVVRAYRPAAANGGYDEKDQEYVYNAFGLKKSEGLWVGNHWAATSYAYFTDPAQLSAGSPQSRTGPNPGQSTTWSYDYASFPQSMYAVTETTLNVADPAGTASSLVKETAYDWVSGWKLYDKDPRGYATEYSYDRLGRLTDTLKPGDEASLPAGNWGVSHTNAPWEHYAYDDTALTATVTKGIYPSGTMKAYEVDSYDSLGQLTRIDKYNTVGTSGNQLVGLAQTQIVTTRATYDPWGDVASMTDPNGNTTNYSYDVRGRVSVVTHADATKTRSVYDDAQNLRTTTNERGVITQEWLSWNGQTLTKVDDVGYLNITTATYYNGQDEVVAQTDALNQTTITYYGPFGKPSGILHPSVDIWESPSQPVSSIPGGFTTKSVTPEDLFTYDDAGQLIIQQSGYQGAWHETDQTFDAAGRIIKKATGIPGVDTREEWNWYDADGNLIKHADALLVSRIEAGQSDSAGTSGFSLKTYSSRNKVLTETDPLGAVVHYLYDFLDRKIRM